MLYFFKPPVLYLLLHCQQAENGDMVALHSDYYQIIKRLCYEVLTTV